jgi:type II secretory pathway pseudopilin PulG
MDFVNFSDSFNGRPNRFMGGWRVDGISAEGPNNGITLAVFCLTTGNWPHSKIKTRDMVTRYKQIAKPKAGAAFTLVEVVMSVTILALAMAGMIYGYVQTNYRAEWSSMSLAVQALTIESIEQARAANWDVYTAAGPGVNPDGAPVGTNTIIYTNALVVPASGQTVSVTNILKITTISMTPNPWVRQYRSDSKWFFPITSTWYTNTVITYRAGS